MTIDDTITPFIHTTYPKFTYDLFIFALKYLVM